MSITDKTVVFSYLYGGSYYRYIADEVSRSISDLSEIITQEPESKYHPPKNTNKPSELVLALCRNHLNK